MRLNRGLVFWGVALVSAGLVALAIQYDLIAEESARQAWQLWPVALIVIGLAVIAGRTPFAMVASLAAGIVVGGLVGTLVAGWPDGLAIGCGGSTDEQVAANGTFSGATAEVDLEFDCGELAVAMGDGTGWSVDARHGSNAEPTIEDGAASLRVDSDDSSWFGLGDARQAWDVTLPTDVELALEVGANAASSTLDLAGASFTSLSIDANAGEVALGLEGASADEVSIEANAGSVGITVDDSTTVAASIQLNAGSLELCVPDGASVAVTVNDDNVTFSHDLEDSGLSQSGSTWRSGDGDTDVTFEVEGNAASLAYNPDGGCS